MSNSKNLELLVLLNEIKSTSQTFDNFLENEKDSLVIPLANFISCNEQIGGLNPILISGDFGNGKTHLLRAISEKFKSNFPDSNLLFCQFSDFTSDFISSIVDHDRRLIDKYKFCDVLIIDNIHRLNDKEKTQNEFALILEHRIQLNKPTIISQCTNSELDVNFSTHLKSIIRSGINLKLEEPNFQMRFNFLRLKCNEFGIELPEKELQALAKNGNSFREVLSSFYEFIIFNTKVD
jgi:chromosomal replication initiator protein